MPALMAKLAEARQHRHYKKCERCKMRYDPRKGACPHCAGLDEQQLKRLREQQARTRAGNRSLGKAFLFTAGVLVLLLLSWLLLGVY